ncbi:hypothetical protein F5B19DRAFT_351374 [Rostrohypoxylon terebratum]|nr:hypothetical protein F5B19DRAFT_351374 [Rostrohypoxylon terebratum]
MATICDYDIPKEKRPEGSRNFPLVFPSPVDISSDSNMTALGGISAKENSGHGRTTSNHNISETRGFSAYGKAMSWSDADHPFDKTANTVQCPEPDSDGQESTTSNTPKVVLPPLMNEQRDSGLLTSIHDHHQQATRMVAEDLSQNELYSRAPLGPSAFNQQPQGRGMPGASIAPSRPFRTNDPRGPNFKPASQQIISDPRQIRVSSPTFNAYYTPLQSRREHDQEENYFRDLQRAQMTGPPDTTGPQPLRQSQRLRKLEIRRRNLEIRMAREEAARSFDSDDDREFYPHND